MKKLSDLCRLFAILLVVVMVLVPMTSTVFAVADADAGLSVPTTSEDLSGLENKPDEAEYTFRPVEIPTRRERNVKHFALGEGEYQAVVYGDAVHRMNADGTWRDIDNRLLPDGANRFTTPDGRVSVAANTDLSEGLLSLEENGYFISMKPYDNGASTAIPGLCGELLSSAAEIENHTERSVDLNNTLDELMRVDNTTRVTYASAYPSTDIEYVLTGDTIKENIIVNEPGDAYTYAFLLRLSGLYPVLTDNGEIHIYDEETDEEQYIIPAPYMYDANGVHSDAVNYRLATTEEEGEYLLVVQADANWFSARGRAFPVTIDPWITKNVTADTFIDQNDKDSNYNSADCLWVGTYTTVLMKVPTPSIPQGSTIVSANLYVYCYYVDHVTSGNMTMAVSPINYYWNPSTVTWNTANQNPNLGLSSTRLSTAVLEGNKGYYRDSPKCCTFSIKSLVESWMSGTPNYGIAVRFESGANDSACIRSRESGSEYTAYYSITYRQPVLSSGVYYLKDTISGKNLDTRDGGYSAGAVLQAWEKTDYFNRNQLYKITYVGARGDKNMYTVRPMTNCGLALCYHATGGTDKITFENAPYTNDQSIFTSSASDFLWTFPESNGKYAIKNWSTVPDDYLSIPSNSSNGTLAVPSGALYWMPERYTEELGEIEWRNFIYEFYAGQTYTFICTMYSSKLYVNGPITYSIEILDKYDSDSVTINSNTGFFRTIKDSALYLTASCSGVPSSKQTVVVYPGYNDVYCIQNKQHSKYLQPSPDNHTTLELWDADGGSDQRWKIVGVGLGRYKIESVDTGKVVAVYPGKQAVNNYELTMEDYTGDHRQQWWIDVSDRGNYVFRPVSASGTGIDFCMGAGDYLFLGNGLNVNQRKYTDDNELRDEWAFIPQ